MAGNGISERSGKVVLLVFPNEAAERLDDLRMKSGRV